MRRSRDHLVRSRGFSLIEFITSGALTLLLLAGVAAIFIGSRTSYGKAEQLGQIQENGRYALDQISHDLRAAGFPGCSARVPVTALAPNMTLADLQTPIRSFNAGPRSEWQPWLPDHVAPFALPGSDVLIVNTSSAPFSLAAAMQSDTDVIQLEDGAAKNLKSGAVLLASNCQARATFAIASINEDVLNFDAASTVESDGPDATLGFAFPRGTELMQLHTHAYFLRRDPTTSHSALWRKVDRNPPEQLAAGIEDLQFTFGVDNDGDGVVDVDTTADQIADWQAVRTVSIRLVVVATDTSKASPNGASDLRETFTTAVTLRNRASTQS